MVPWRSAPLIVISLVLASACGGNSVSGPTRSEAGGGNTSSSGQAVTIRGGERLAWDQVASTGQAVQALHNIELSAISSGRESSRSAPMAVMMAGGSQAP
jgi:hypothetical protein